MILDIYKPGVKFGLHSSYYIQKGMYMIKKRKMRRICFVSNITTGHFHVGMKKLGALMLVSHSAIGIHMW